MTNVTKLARETEIPRSNFKSLITK